MNFPNNTLFNCDALSVVERLPSNSVTLTYLNPPWNTRKGFTAGSNESEVPPDVEFARHLTKVVQQVRRLLNDRGSLFVHWEPSSPIDLRLIANQVFGDLPRHEITWPRKKFGNMMIAGLRPEHDVLLVYCKSDDALSDPLFRKHSIEEAATYSRKDQRGPYRLLDLTSPVDRPALQQEWRGITPPSGKSWRYSIVKLETLFQTGSIEFDKFGGRPILKQYLADQPGTPVGTNWDDIPDHIQSSERTDYRYQLPLALLNRIVNLASKEGDRVLDPFCGSGTTLIAAQSLGRAWWGAEESTEGQRITIQRLQAVCGLNVDSGYDVLNEQKLMAYPVDASVYKTVLVSVEEIANLQRKAEMLVESIVALKKSLNIGDDADEVDVESAIAAMEKLISDSIASGSKSLDSYIGGVREWMIGWDVLDHESRLFLPSGELLFETIQKSDGKDYSPFILQYCRALENELLIKLFSAYTTEFHSRHEDSEAFLASDLKVGEDGKLGKRGRFANLVKSRDPKYTLGDMNFIMGLSKEHGENLKLSPLLQDFRAFTLRYFERCIVEKKYLSQIERITKDFRNNAAHPAVLDLEVALRCREAVRACLNELILNYKRPPSTAST